MTRTTQTMVTQTASVGHMEYALLISAHIENKR